MGPASRVHWYLKEIFPLFILAIGQSQFAVDQQMAEGIYVRLEKGSEK